MTMLARSNSIDLHRSKPGRRTGPALFAALLCGTALAMPAHAQEATATAEADAQDGNDIVVTGSLNALPVKDVGSVFGFDKTLVETPRSASTISDEQIERWCDKLQCNEEERRRAVADVGDLPLQVAEHLGLTEAALT